MRCGAKRFLAEIELDGENKMKSVIARTPAEARKTIRSTYGVETNIISVREERRISGLNNY